MYVPLIDRFLRDLALDVERDFVGVLILDVVGHVQRPRLVDDCATPR